MSLLQFLGTDESNPLQISNFSELYFMMTVNILSMNVIYRDMDYVLLMAHDMYMDAVLAVIGS
jgi:hypothetical protein